MPKSLGSNTRMSTALFLLVTVGCGGGGGSGGGAVADSGTGGATADAATGGTAGGGAGGAAGGSAGGAGGAPGGGAGGAAGGAAGAAGASGSGGSGGVAGSASGGSGGSAGNPASVWHHVFDMTGESSLTDVVELPSGDSIAVGAVSSFGSGLADGLVARFSPDGAYLWSRAIGTAQVDGLDAVTGDGSGGVVVVGHSNYSGSVVSFVARFDASGNLVFAKDLNAPTVDLFWDSNLVLTDVVRMSNGNFALIGHHEDDDKTTASVGQFRGWIGVINPTGALVKQRRFGSSTAYLGFYGGAELPGGDLAVVGWWNESGLVMRLDSALTVKWRSTQASEFNDYGADFVSILPLASGDLIVGGRYFQADFSTTVSHWFVQRVSGTGTGVWARRLEHDFSGVSGLFAHGANQFVALGYAPNGSDANAYAAILDDNGFLLSQHSLGLSGTDWLTRGVVSNDGSLLVAGYDGGTPHGSARLAKVKDRLPPCDASLGNQLASVTYPPPPAPDTADFGANYTVTVSSTGPTTANGPASVTPSSVCAP